MIQWWIHAKDATRGPASLSSTVARAGVWISKGKQRPSGTQYKDNIEIHAKWLGHCMTMIILML